MSESISNQLRIDETIVLLSRLEDLSYHRLAGHIAGNLEINAVTDKFYYQPLKSIFSRVVQYDFIKRMTETGISKVNDEIIELVRKEKPKYVLWLSTMYEIMETTLDAIRKEGSIVIGWFGDDEYRFGYYSKWWIPHIDYAVIHDTEAEPRYRKLGGRPVRVFSCEGIPVQRDWSKINEQYEISFVGRKTKTMREEYIDEITKRDLPIHLFGRGWNTGYVPADKMFDIFWESKINLNFSAASNYRKSLKGRMTIVCLAGGFLLTEYAPGLEDVFEIGKEVECFRDAREMISKIEYYLAHDEERRAIARAGWTRAVNEYTPVHMMSRIFTEIERDIASGAEQNKPVEMKMPLWVRNSRSRFYFQWGKAYLKEGYTDQAKDALKLALRGNSFYIPAWYYRIASLLPAFLRGFFIKVYIPFEIVRKLSGKIILKLLILVDSVSFLKTLKRTVSRKLHFS